MARPRGGPKTLDGHCIFITRTKSLKAGRNFGCHADCEPWSHLSRECLQARTLSARGAPTSSSKSQFLDENLPFNIDRLGRICLDIPKEKWCPALQIQTVLLSIQALMSAPNPDVPLSNEAAEHRRTNECGALAQAKAWNQQFALH